ncbi:MAG TPA: enolase C-terminal domain-like protein [Verrucomicrobiae bacterium]|nr:enolase C-terminal domain-like protein [Verrucomicrobiae bacterium]
MRITDVRERSVPISRYADPALPSGGLTTSIVAIETDVLRAGKRIVGYGFSSIGRFAQGGLIRERFAPRLLAAAPEELIAAEGTNFDPFRAWSVMMRGEKPGGHGERCVAVGTLDMALWDIAAKIAEQPLYYFLSSRLNVVPVPTVNVYAGGGYYYPTDDIAALTNEIQRLLGGGYTRFKMKIGGKPVAEDRKRIEAALSVTGDGARLAADAMNAYDADTALTAAQTFAPCGLWWFEDVCDPLDFATQAAVARVYPGAIAAGEALFSDAEAKLLDAHGGLRTDRDILLFDPVHCYGVPGYLRIVEAMTQRGWPRSAFWPHGGHIFSLHLVAALGLGGAEVNPLCFAPFGGLQDGVTPVDGRVAPSQCPGIGFESKPDLRRLFETL